MTNKSFFSVLLTLIVLVFLSACGGDTEGEIHYCSVGDYALDDNTIGMNIEIPEGEGPFPTILFVHGGYWSQGDLSDYNAEILEAASKGYVAATIDYRLTSVKNSDGSVKYPWDAQLEDTKCAVRYLRAQASQYKIDSNKIGIAGFSAGAHLSLMTGFTPNQMRFEQEGQHKSYSSTVQAVVAFSTPTDLGTLYYQSEPKEKAQEAAKDLLQGTPEEKPLNYIDASPIEYASQANTPVLLIHGDADDLVPMSQAEAMITQLDQFGHINHNYIVYEGVGHGWSGKMGNHANEQMFSFFDYHLKNITPLTLSCSPYPSCQK